MGALASRLAAETPKQRLTFTEWVISLEPADRQALEEAGRNRAWSNAALARVIHEEGGVAGKDAITRWRASLR